MEVIAVAPRRVNGGEAYFLDDNNSSRDAMPI